MDSGYRCKFALESYKKFVEQPDSVCDVLKAAGSLVCNTLVASFDPRHEIEVQFIRTD